MEAKYKIGDTVTATGTATGYGDLQCLILEVSIKQSDDVYYTLSTNHGKMFIAQRYLK